MALAESRASGASTAALQPTWLQTINPVAVLVGVIVVIMPMIASRFVLTQIFGWSYMLGTIALSLMFLAGYGGMVSLAQMTIAGFAGYLVAILGVNGVPGGIGWPWWLAVPAALIFAMVVGAVIGALAVRTAGINHDYACDRGGVLLFRQPELRDLQRPHRH
jgi:branched-chain amino acid transport system permease protein